MQLISQKSMLVAPLLAAAGVHAAGLEDLPLPKVETFQQEDKMQTIYTNSTAPVVATIPAPPAVNETEEAIPMQQHQNVTTHILADDIAVSEQADYQLPAGYTAASSFEEVATYNDDHDYALRGSFSSSAANSGKKSKTELLSEAVGADLDSDVNAPNPAGETKPVPVAEASDSDDDSAQGVIFKDWRYDVAAVGLLVFVCALAGVFWKLGRR